MKKLIPALCMLLVAATLLGTSTFAWFSMNSQVSATGMQVTANSDSKYLLIGDINDHTAIQNNYTITTSLTVSESAAKVFPAAHLPIANTAAAIATNATYTYYENKTDDTDTISADHYATLSEEVKAKYKEATATGSNWYYQIADAPNASASTKAPQPLATVDGTYVIRKTCYVTMAAGSNDGENLKIAGITIAKKDAGETKTIDPIKVLVTTSTAAVELDKNTTTSDTVLATTVTATGVVAVDIFIYYDGTHESVKTENVAKLDGATISLTFKID